PDLAQTGAAVALDIATGEVLVLASKPDYDLAEFSPHASQATVDSITQRGAWQNLALNGFYPPGSTFKILTSIAGLHRGALDPDQPIINCDGVMMLGRTPFVCFNRLGRHGDVLLGDALSHSCDIYFYEAGRRTTPDGLAAEARRFRLDQRTGIELPGEDKRMLIPDPEWKRARRHEDWFPGDTANMSIGQGAVTVSPLQMACFIASVARDEVATIPTLVHNPARPPQHTERIGLTPAQRAALIAGLEACVKTGTASKVFKLPIYAMPGVRIAGKTGTAQKDVVQGGKSGKINIAWFVCFAPVDKPEIAVAVAIVGDTVGESFEGSSYAAPVAAKILRHYFEKSRRPAPSPLFTP
ncbi:MAG: hypothetical protein RLZZ15_2232, partial [Verrucomicrobiota bacterium]